MIGRLPKPKRNPHSGRKPRANPFLRAWRLARRKRVAYARAQACDTAKHLQQQLARIDHLAKAYDVPVDPMPALPVIPQMPSQDWIEFRQDLGPLREPVKPAQPAPNATQAMA